MELSGDRVSRELLGDAFDALRRARAVGPLRREMGKFARRMGFERFAFSLRVTAPSLPPSHFAVTNYPAAWGERYLARGYFKVDPVAVHCECSALSAVWYEQASHGSRTGPFWEEAGAFGLRSGLSLRVHAGAGAVGVFSLSRDQRLDLCGEDLAALIGRAHVFAGCVQHCLSRLGPLVAMPWPANPLTLRERECLKWTVDGKTAWEIGHILGIAERTANFHIYNAMRKLEATNKTQAAVRALELELLH